MLAMLKRFLALIFKISEKPPVIISEPKPTSIPIPDIIIPETPPVEIKPPAPIEPPKPVEPTGLIDPGLKPVEIFHNKALPLVLVFEGEYDDNPNDYGGRTMKGITQREYDKYLGKKGLPGRHVKLILDEEVKDIYFKDYWLASKCDFMSEKLAICVFDTSVNNGQGRSIKILQKSIGAKVDGIIGQETIEKLRLQDPVKIANTFMDFREKKYRDIVAADSTQVEFLDGWLRRALMVRAFINGTKTVEQIRKEW